MGICLAAGSSLQHRGYLTYVLNSFVERSSCGNIIILFSLIDYSYFEVGLMGRKRRMLGNGGSAIQGWDLLIEMTAVPGMHPHEFTLPFGEI